MQGNVEYPLQNLTELRYHKQDKLQNMKYNCKILVHQRKMFFSF